jgi:hypothetical protein
MKWEKAPPQILEEAARAWTMIPLFVIPFTLLVVLASSTSGDQHPYRIVTLCRPLHQDWERATATGKSLARDDKGPSRGKQLPEERSRETAET